MSEFWNHDVRESNAALKAEFNRSKRGEDEMKPASRTGKSIRDRMRDCIAVGMDAKSSAEEIARQISMKRISKKQLIELHRELSGDSNV